LRKFANAHLAQRSRGILHIGAHEGSDEALTYQGKNVIWIEANPELMNGLNENIAANHRAFCALLGDRRQVVDFKIASNGGASSSVFDLGPGNESLWPSDNIKMEKTVRLPMTTLDSFVEERGIDLHGYDHWVLDVQGAELLVLHGAKNSLSNCQTIQTEISTVELYTGGVSYPELKRFLIEADFVPLFEPHALTMKHGDIVFVRKSLYRPLWFRCGMFLAIYFRAALFVANRFRAGGARRAADARTPLSN
jgi:FkbM family methyltransferase